MTLLKSWIYKTSGLALLNLLHVFYHRPSAQHVTQHRGIDHQFLAKMLGVLWCNRGVVSIQLRLLLALIHGHCLTFYLPISCYYYRLQPLQMIDKSINVVNIDPNAVK